MCLAGPVPTGEGTSDEAYGGLVLQYAVSSTMQGIPVGGEGNEMIRQV